MSAESVETVVCEAVERFVLGCGIREADEWAAEWLTENTVARGPRATKQAFAAVDRARVCIGVDRRCCCLEAIEAASKLVAGRLYSAAVHAASAYAGAAAAGLPAGSCEWGRAYFQAKGAIVSRAGFDGRHWSRA